MVLPEALDVDTQEPLNTHTVFAETLVKARLAAGFKSAYQFYHHNGGRRHFPFTYVHYLRLEKGVRLPRPKWMAFLLMALRLTPGEAGSRQFFLDYLRSVLGTDEAYSMILAPLLAAAAAPPLASREAFKWMKAQHSVHLTPEQFKALVSDETTYWCSEIILNDSGSWNVDALHEVLKMEPKKIQASLEKLKDSGVVRETSPGNFRARWAGKFYTFPGKLRDMSGSLASVRSHWERMSKERGSDRAYRVELVRADEGTMRNYLSVLAETMDTANVIATHTQSETSGLFLIESKVRKLMPF